ncbi:hypothetical protein QFZ49_005184 [Streptomyces turgidiscabies]|uniref:Uncharacterized protein n=1 Tax=Streptomyces turgidiscabies TaxID=85558 RepID=A0ABU0RT96_9ACTN|nr:hypothetical protein [Streptomyces turgidiscabies]
MSCGTRTQQAARAILMAPNSSVHSLNAGTAPLRTAGDATCSVACHSATLRQPAPSPVLHLLWLRTPLPNLPVRASAADAFTEVPLTDCTAGYCELHLRVLPLQYCSRRPLITAGHPVRPSVPSPSYNPGSGTPPPHRPANCNCVLLPGSSCLPGPAVSLGYERNHNHTTTQCLLQPTQIFCVSDGEAIGHRAAIRAQMESAQAEGANRRPAGAGVTRHGLVQPRPRPGPKAVGKRVKATIVVADDPGGHPTGRLM